MGTVYPFVRYLVCNKDFIIPFIFTYHGRIAVTFTGFRCHLECGYFTPTMYTATSTHTLRIRNLQPVLNLLKDVASEKPFKPGVVELIPYLSFKEGENIGETYLSPK